MKTTIIRAVVALSLAAAALMAPTAANAYTDPAVITVSPSVLTVGDTATFTTSGRPGQSEDTMPVLLDKTTCAFDL